MFTIFGNIFLFVHVKKRLSICFGISIIIPFKYPSFMRGRKLPPVPGPVQQPSPRPGAAARAQAPAIHTLPPAVQITVQMTVQIIQGVGGGMISSLPGSIDKCKIGVNNFPAAGFGLRQYKQFALPAKAPPRHVFFLTFCVLLAFMECWPCHFK